MKWPEVSRHTATPLVWAPGGNTQIDEQTKWKKAAPKGVPKAPFGSHVDPSVQKGTKIDPKIDQKTTFLLPRVRQGPLARNLVIYYV